MGTERQLRQMGTDWVLNGRQGPGQGPSRIQIEVSGPRAARKPGSVSVRSSHPFPIQNGT